MRRRSLLIFAIAGASLGCSVAEVQTDDLAAIVERDAVSFEMDSIPPEVMQRLAAGKVLLVGETHWIYEHRDLMARLVEALHSHGLRQVILEFPQAAEWLLEDYVNGSPLEPEWAPPLGLEGDFVTAIRDFNAGLSQEDRVRVRGIDVMLAEYGGASDFMWLVGKLSEHISDPGPIDAFTGMSYETPDDQQQALSYLQSEMGQREEELKAAWGDDWFGFLTEMLDVEVQSVSIREMRSDNYDESARLRESVMKELTDARLRGQSHKTLINVGGNHAQKTHLKGTEQEWLGDYLVHKSTAAGGAVFVLNVAPTLIVSEDLSQTLWEVEGASPPNELWRIMGETHPNKLVFLPFDDPIFDEEGILLNYEDVIYKAAPKQVYDAFISLPVARRIPG